MRFYEEELLHQACLETAQESDQAAEAVEKEEQMSRLTPEREATIRGVANYEHGILSDDRSRSLRLQMRELLAEIDALRREAVAWQDAGGFGSCREVRRLAARVRELESEQAEFKLLHESACASVNVNAQKAAEWFARVRELEDKLKGTLMILSMCADEMKRAASSGWTGADDYHEAIQAADAALAPTRRDAP